MSKLETGNETEMYEFQKHNIVAKLEIVETRARYGYVIRDGLHPKTNNFKNNKENKNTGNEAIKMILKLI